MELTAQQAKMLQEVIESAFNKEHITSPKEYISHLVNVITEDVIFYIENEINVIEHEG